MQIEMGERNFITLFCSLVFKTVAGERLLIVECLRRGSLKQSPNVRWVRRREMRANLLPKMRWIRTTRRWESEGSMLNSTYS